MSYSFVTKANFNNLIASRLDDVNKVYWTNDEINKIIDEALLTFAAISSYWKHQLLIETIANQQVYDILDSDDVANGFDNIEVDLTYQTIIDWLTYTLIGYSNISSTSEILSLITGAINLFQKETKLVLGVATINVAAEQDVNIGEDVLDIVNAYININDNKRALKLASEENIGLYNSNYLISPAIPKFYSTSNLSLRKLKLYPPANQNATLEIIYVKGKASGQAANSSCLIPNNLVPYIKYKVLADIFNKDNIKDARAEYAIQRWNEGLLIGKNYSAILNTRLNGVIKPLTSFSDFDNARFNWRNDVETSIKKVNAIALAGYNIVAVNRLPTNVYSILSDAVSNAPINNVNIDIRPDYIPYLLDYCLHIASIKDGIPAVQRTMNLFNEFVKVAFGHNIYLQNRNISYRDLIYKSKYPLVQAKVA